LSTLKNETTNARQYNWQEMPVEELNSDIGRRFVSGEKMMIAHIYLKKGAVVPLHSHHNEQVSYILEGALKLVLGEDQTEEFTVAAGELLVIPPNVPHSAEALEDTIDLDIFSPPRQDWLDGSDSYLRTKPSR